MQKDTVIDYAAVNIDDPVLLDWSLDGKYLCLASLGRSGIWVVDFQSNKVIRSLDVDSDGTPNCVWSPSGDFLIAESKDQLLTIWDTSNWQIRNSFKVSGGDLRDISWRNDEKFVAISGDLGVQIWNVGTGNFIIVQSERSHTAVWNTEGTMIATDLNNQIHIWDVANLPN